MFFLRGLLYEVKNEFSKIQVRIVFSCFEKEQIWIFYKKNVFHPFLFTGFA